MNSVNISCLLFFCLMAHALAVSPLINQVWWSKLTASGDQTGCKAMCCSGRNSTCHSNGPRMGGKIAANGRCFCDEGCLDMEDCCEDYSVECQAVDCKVSDWDEWSDCSKQCGLGSKTKTREIIQEPRNGGQECPVLEKSTICMGTKCKSQRHIGRRGRVDQETARVMPASFGVYRGFREYNAHLDIRKNLFYKYYAQRTIERKGYCATFEITSTRASCSNPSAPWASVLEKGTQICVECQTKAMDGSNGRSCIGHGNTEKDTFWTAVNAHGCHGWWRRVNELSECSCKGHQGLDFIFV